MPGPARRFQKCFSTLCHSHSALQGRPAACPCPEPGEPSHFLRACCTLVLAKRERDASIYTSNIQKLHSVKPADAPLHISQCQT